MKFVSKVDEIIDKLRAEGKVTELTDSEVQAIRDRINKSMKGFRRELRRKQWESERDTRAIVLTNAQPRPVHHASHETEPQP